MEHELLENTELQKKQTLPIDELNRLTGFFEILIQIDQRERKKQCKK